MASEGTEETTRSAVVPEPLGRWLDDRAREAGVDPEEFLGRLLAAYRLAESDGADADRDVALDRLDGRIADLRAEYEETLADVRERVVDVKLDADGKASADHDHDDLRAAADRLAAEVESLAGEVESLRSRTEAGFENYEDVLEYLTDATEDVEGRTGVLARAVVDVRERSWEATRRAAARAAADELARAANRKGVRRADCGECGGGVDVALLSAPECPFCGATFADVRVSGGLGPLFRSAELVVGEPPALEGAVAPDAEDLEAVLADGPVETAGSASPDDGSTDDGATSGADHGEGDG